MRRIAALFTLVGLALLFGAGPAAAHNVLIGSDPADGAALATGPERVSLTFDLPVQPGFTTLTVTGPDGNQWQADAPVEDGATVTAAIRELGPAGEYRIGYQVLSADSHPVRGVVRFTLTTPGNGSPAAPPDTAGADPAGAEPAGGDTPVWPWLAGAGVLLAAGVLVALRVGRSG
ncbi:MAG: copper resistance CopC family protein [Pseudonocardiaceae bacterium]